MGSIIAALSLVFVSSMSPGPNNLIVFNAAINRGFKGSLPAIVGILTGAILMSIVACTGVAGVIAAQPKFQFLLGIVGSSYLIWLGGKIIFQANKRSQNTVNANRSPNSPITAKSAVLLQFINPKAWIMITTVAIELSTHFSGVLLLLIQLTILLLVSSFCLLCWAILGSKLSSWLQQPAVQVPFDLMMGTLLILSASYMLFSFL